MGLTHLERTPDGKVLRIDVTVAKNDLSREELESLGRIVNAYLDLTEERACRKIPMTMEDWAKRLDAFLASTPRLICLFRFWCRSQAAMFRSPAVQPQEIETRREPASGSVDRPSGPRGLRHRKAHECSGVAEIFTPRA